MSGTALREQTELAAEGRPLETVTCKRYVLYARHWTWWNCRRMLFLTPGSASSPNQTSAEQLHHPVGLALAASIDPEVCTSWC